MSYFLVDDEGTVKDLASNAGLQQLRAGAPQLFRVFLDSGEIAEEQVAALADMLRGDSKYGYISDLLDDMSGGVVLSNGIEEDTSDFTVHRDYWFRTLTKYEKRVDFKAIQGIFDEDALTVDGQIRAELRKTRDSLLKKIEEADNGARLTPEFISGLKLDTNQEVGRILGDYLLDVWRSGRDLAFKELPGAIKAKVEPVRQFGKMAAYQTGLEPIDALNYFRTRALILAGIIDDDLLKQAKFELLEHIKGGRPLIETVGNLRSVFEPWVGDPTKIAPSGQIGIGFLPGTMAPENILMAYRLETIIRTESTTAMAQGRVAMGDAAGDYVIGYQLSAILDERTTEICKAADGLLFRKEDPNSIKLLPALHYQCRTVPIFATSDELPIEWSSQAKIDAVLRLIPAGFK